MAISDGTSVTPTIMEMRGILADRDMPGRAILGYRVQFGELWAGRWNPEGPGVLASTVYKPSQRKVLTVDEWNAWHVVSGVQ